MRLVPAYGLYYLDNQPTLLRAGPVPYWRIPAERWREHLERLHEAGCNAALVSVPWVWHAPAEGQTDLRGATSPQRDLAALLNLSERVGLVVHLAPGPAPSSIESAGRVPSGAGRVLGNAWGLCDARVRSAGRVPSGAGRVLAATPSGRREIRTGRPDSASGYPPWMAQAIPAALARRADGRPIGPAGAPRFSLLHPAFLARVGAWYKEVAGVVRPLENGPVVAWLVHGGGPPGAERDGSTATPRASGSAPGPALGEGWAAPDFNPVTAGRYRAFLTARYSSVRLLAREWRREVKSFEEVLPPRDQRSHGELADWQAFMEEWHADYLGRLRDLARDHGISVPLAAADPAGAASALNPRLRAGNVDLYGYTVGDDGPFSGRFMGSPFMGSPFLGSQAALRFEPFSTEERPLTCWWAGSAPGHLAGGVPTSEPAPGYATLHTIAGGLAHGLKGYAVGVDEAAVARLQRWLETAAEELTASVEVRDALAYLDYQPYSRRTPDGALAPSGPWWRPAGPAGDPDWRCRYGLHALLLTCGYNPSVVDLQQASDAELAEFPAAVFPSLGYLAVEDYGKLVVFTLRGGSLVSFPQPATRQADGTPLNTQFLWPHRGDEARTSAPAAGAERDRQREPWGPSLLGRWRVPWRVRQSGLW